MTDVLQHTEALPSETELTLKESYRWCRALSKRTAGNFYYSFLTLPADRLHDMCALYAFMRVSDDLGDDESLTTADRREKLKTWRASLQRALQEHRFEHPALPALAEVVERYQIPHEYLHAVIDGIEMDLEPAGFETFDELAHYCYHVAGVVGLCCIHIWGFRDEGAGQGTRGPSDRGTRGQGDKGADEQRLCDCPVVSEAPMPSADSSPTVRAAVDCGLAFQLTNILRDLGEDAAMGRCYLPAEDLRRFDYPERELKAHRRDDRFRQLMRFQVERARQYYDRAGALYQYLDPAGRSILRAMLGIYGGLLDEIERRDYDVFTSRVALPRWRKLMIGARAVIGERWLRRR